MHSGRKLSEQIQVSAVVYGNTYMKADYEGDTYQFSQVSTFTVLTVLKHGVLQYPAHRAVIQNGRIQVTVKVFKLLRRNRCMEGEHVQKQSEFRKKQYIRG